MVSSDTLFLINISWFRMNQWLKIGFIVVTTSKEDEWFRLSSWGPHRCRIFKKSLGGDHIDNIVHPHRHCVRIGTFYHLWRCEILGTKPHIFSHYFHKWYTDVTYVNEHKININVCDRCACKTNDPSEYSAQSVLLKCAH